MRSGEVDDYDVICKTILINLQLWICDMSVSVHL